MIEYKLASDTWDNKEIEAINSVISKNMFTMGDAVAQFEQEFAKYTDNKYAVMVNSGSSANLLAIAALFYRKNGSLKPGDEVIVPAVSWPTTYYPLYQYGLKLKFIDIDLHTLNFDLEELKTAITDKTKLIFAVNLLGNPNNFDEINKLIKNKDIILIEDNCESLGATYKGKQAGSFGLMGTYSTFYSHHMATMEGGLVCTDDEELYHILLSIRSHGWTRHLPEKNQLCTKSDEPFDELFRFILPGYNVRPIEMMGAIGSEQLKKLPSFIENRIENAKYFQELFGKDDRFIIQKDIDKSSWFGFSMVIKKESGIDRQQLINMLRANNIETRPIVSGNFAKNEVLKYFNYEIHGDLKNANYIDKYGFFVGNQQVCIKEQIKFLKDVLDNKLK